MFEGKFDEAMNLSKALELPNLTAWLGRDALGRDLLVRILMMIQEIVLPMWVSCCLACLLGVVFSTSRIAFFPTSRILIFIERIILSIFTLPIMLLTFGFVLLLEKTSFWGLMIPILCQGFCQGYELTQGLFRRDQSLEFWSSHQVLGGALWERFINYGILQSWKSEILILMLTLCQMALLTEVALAYLGMGIPEPLSSFGNLLASHYDLILKGYWHPTGIICVSFIVVLWLPHVGKHYVSKISSTSHF